MTSWDGLNRFFIVSFSPLYGCKVNVNLTKSLSLHTTKSTACFTLQTATPTPKWKLFFFSSNWFTGIFVVVALLCSSFYGMCTSVFELILCVESLISASQMYQLPYCPSVNNDSQTQCGCIQTFLQYVICMSVCACAEKQKCVELVIPPAPPCLFGDSNENWRL